MFLHDDDRLLTSSKIIFDKIPYEGMTAVLFNHRIKYESGVKYNLFLKEQYRRLLKNISKKMNRLDLINSILYVPSIIGAIFHKSAYLELEGLRRTELYSADYDLILRYISRFGAVKLKESIIEYNHGSNTSSVEGITRILAEEAYLIRMEIIMSYYRVSLNRERLISFVSYLKEYELNKKIPFYKKIKILYINFMHYLNLI